MRIFGNLVVTFDVMKPSILIFCNDELRNLDIDNLKIEINKFILLGQSFISLKSMKFAENKV